MLSMPPDEYQIHIPLDLASTFCLDNNPVITSVHFMYVFKNADFLVEKCLKMSRKLQGGDRKISRYIGWWHQSGSAAPGIKFQNAADLSNNLFAKTRCQALLCKFNHDN